MWLGEHFDQFNMNFVWTATDMILFVFPAAQTLISACQEQNVDQFTEAVRDYDSISRLDQWYTTMLLRVKKTIEGEGDLK